MPGNNPLANNMLFRQDPIHRNTLQSAVSDTNASSLILSPDAIEYLITTTDLIGDVFHTAWEPVTPHVVMLNIVTGRQDQAQADTIDIDRYYYQTPSWGAFTFVIFYYIIQKSIDLSGY